VILLGNGVRLSGCQELFEQVINRLKVPVLGTWKAGDMMHETHPLYCGKPGAIGQRGANFIQQNADWLLTLGARLDLCQVAHNYPNFARAAKKVIVDIDDAEIGKLRQYGMVVDIDVACDVKHYLAALLQLLEEVPLKNYAAWLTRCREWKSRYPVIPQQPRESTGLVNPYVFIEILTELLTADDLLVPGSSGSCAEITQQAFQIKKGQRMLNTPGLGSMGFGLPAAIGACIASGGRRTISIIGDGGLQHNIQELETLSRLNLPVKLFILNNGGYGSIKTMQDNHFESRYTACNPQSGLTLPDSCRIAAAYRLKTRQIASSQNLKRQVAEFLQDTGPALCDLIVDPDVSRPMEDLWPYLDREEFERNMAVSPMEGKPS
jgi:acetolactate synthase-1/2/3 large subunit